MAKNSKKFSWKQALALVLIAVKISLPFGAAAALSGCTDDNIVKTVVCSTQAGPSIVCP
jgi:hypothetical protein